MDWLTANALVIYAVVNNEELLRGQIQLNNLFLEIVLLIFVFVNVNEISLLLYYKEKM